MKDKFLIKNAIIYPAAAKTKVYQCLVVSDGEIIAAGDNQLSKDWESRVSASYDLEGCVVFPGFTDAHIHLEKYAYSLDQVDCETSSVEACLERIQAATSSASPGSWIRGHGWNQNTWGRFGTLDELDAITPDHPVYLTAKSLHAAWCNSVALNVCDIDRSNFPGGRIGTNPDGSLNGILFEDAMKLVSENIPRPTLSETIALIRKAQDQLLHFGITSIHDFDGQRCFSALQELQRSGELNIRVVKNIQREQLDAIEMLGLRSGFGNQWLSIGHLKLFADGALGPQTAAMLEPYENQPENMGLLLLDRDQVVSIGRRAIENGLPLSVHAIGDQACQTVIKALMDLDSIDQEPHLPHRIEHLQIVHPADLEYLSEANITISMQPLHAPSDHPTADRFWGERSRWAYAWQSVLRTGSLLVFGSDAPVETPDPFQGVYAAVDRKLISEDPSSPTWIPEERIDLQAALESYMVKPHSAVGWDHQLGQLEEGYLADLIVLDQDPYAIPSTDLHQIKVKGAMTGGIWSFLEL
ncbi:MAG: amidohydrolase [Anaerolineales bacterium]